MNADFAINYKAQRIINLYIFVIKNSKRLSVKIINLKKTFYLQAKDFV